MSKYEVNRVNFKGFLNDNAVETGVTSEKYENFLPFRFNEFVY